MEFLGNRRDNSRGFYTNEFTIRIGRKAMTLGGDSSRAAIARSSAIRETKRRASRNLNWLRMTVYRDHLNCGQECMYLSQRQNPSEKELEHCALNRV